jgi:hypothetical protein
VAPSVLFNFLAIREAGVFLFAIVFSSRTSPEVHARRFFALLAIEPPFQCRRLVSLVGTKEKPKDGVENMFVTRNRLTDLTTNTILLGSFLTRYREGSKHFFYTAQGQFCRCERSDDGMAVLIRSKAAKNAVRCCRAPVITL